MAADGSILIDTKLDDSGLVKGLAKLGKTAMAGVGVAAGAIGSLSAAAVAVGKDFESATAKASTLFGDVQVDTDNLNKKILELSDSTGVAASQIGESLYNALSAGIPATEDMGDAMAYMENAAKLAKAGFTDIDTAVTATAKVLNAYGMDVSETDKVHKILMQTQNKGITTVGELGAVLAQVTPTAAAMSMSFDQVGASLATMTAQGTPTAQATTQLNSLLAELGKNGSTANESFKAATEGTKYAGKSFQELMEEGVPVSDILLLISKHAEKNNLSMLDMFSSIEAGKAALSLTNGEGEKYLENLKAMGTEADVVGDAYNKMMDTFDAQKDRLIEGAKNLGIAVYKDMQEPLKNACKFGAESIEQLADAFEEGGLSGLASAAGDVAANAITELASVAPQAIEIGTDIINSFLEGIWRNSDEIVQSAFDIGKILLESLHQIGNQTFKTGHAIVLSLMDGIATSAPKLLQTADMMLGDFLSIISDCLPELVNTGAWMVGELAQSIATELPNLTNTILTGLSDIFTNLVNSIPFVAETGGEVVNAILQGAMDALTVAIDLLPTITESICTAATDLLPQIAEIGVSLFSSLVQDLPIIINNIALALPSIVNSVVGSLLGMTPIIIQCGVDLLTSLVRELPAIAYSITSVLPVIVASIVSTFIGLVPEIIQCGIDLLTSLTAALPQIINCLIAVAPTIIGEIIRALLDSTPLLVRCGFDLLTSLISDLPDTIVKIVSALPLIISEIISSLLANVPMMANCGIDLLTSLVMSLPRIISEIVKAAPKIVSAIVNAFSSGKSKLIEVGKNMIMGLWDGIHSLKDWLVQKARSVAKSVLDEIKDFFGIHSPSKVFEADIGKNLMLGLANGITESARVAVQAAEDAAQEIKDVDFDLDDPKPPKVGPVSGGETDYDALIAEAQGAVRSQNSYASAAVSGTAVAEVVKTVVHEEKQSGTSENAKPKQVVTTVEIDGKQMARQVGPYIEEEIAWSDK